MLVYTSHLIPDTLLFHCLSTPSFSILWGTAPLAHRPNSNSLLNAVLPSTSSSTWPRFTCNRMCPSVSYLFSEKSSKLSWFFLTFLTWLLWLRVTACSQSLMMHTFAIMSCTLSHFTTEYSDICVFEILPLFTWLVPTYLHPLTLHYQFVLRLFTICHNAYPAFPSHLYRLNISWSMFLFP